MISEGFMATGWWMMADGKTTKYFSYDIISHHLPWQSKNCFLAVNMLHYTKRSLYQILWLWNRVCYYEEHNMDVSVDKCCRFAMNDFYWLYCPLSVGPLCIAQHNGKDRRLDDDFPTFKKFNRSLVFSCEEGTLSQSV